MDLGRDGNESKCARMFAGRHARHSRELAAQMKVSGAAHAFELAKATPCFMLPASHLNDLILGQPL